LALKYDIPSSRLLRSWISKYNRHEELKDYDPKGDVYMVKSKKQSHKRDWKLLAIVSNMIDNISWQLKNTMFLIHRFINGLKNI